MLTLLSKTDYILYRECPKNVWYKIHRPDLYSESDLSEFEKTIIETGNEIELIARKLFPTGILIGGRGIESQKLTQSYIDKKQEVLFQPIFIQDGLLAAIDILKYNPEDNSYSVYEVKSTNNVDPKVHFYDLAFQVSLLKKYGLNITQTCIIHLNSEYIRSGELNISELLKIVNATKEVRELLAVIEEETAEAIKYLSQDDEPNGSCCCIYKGRSRHCSTFKHSNPHVPEYGVHDITRIGNSKAKLQELIDGNIFDLNKIPEHIKLSEIQKNQVEAYVLNKAFIDKEKIEEELDKLVFPLYFLDYETFPCAIPRFNGFSPYQQIPFQYSLHVLKSPNEKPEQHEFLHTGTNDPSASFTESLIKDIGKTGSIIVWHKDFECGRNEEIAERIPEAKPFMDALKERIYDLEEIFKKQYHVHKDFQGGTSIKRVLPVLVPELTYKELEIREGGTAADTWNKLVNGHYFGETKERTISNLKVYCGLDTYAMYAIWHKLNQLSGA